MIILSLLALFVKALTDKMFLWVKGLTRLERSVMLWESTKPGRFPVLIMTLYRRDRLETNEHGQTLAYTDWIGGPTLAAIGGVICDDGGKRNAYITGEPSNAWATPAYVSNGKNGKIHGYVSCEFVDNCELYTFNAYHVDNKPYNWLPLTKPIPALTLNR
jgi:hypothetical protein